MEKTPNGKSSKSSVVPKSQPSPAQVHSGAVGAIATELDNIHHRDFFQELMHRSVDALERNLSAVLAVIGVLALTGAGWLGWGWIEARGEKAAQEKFYPLEKHYAEKRDGFERSKFAAQSKTPADKAAPVVATGDLAKDYGDLVDGLESFAKEHSGSAAGVQAGLCLEDIMRPEGLKLMKREVRGSASQRAEVVLRARDGVETTATLITTWSGKGADALTRSIVYVASAAEQQVRRAPLPAAATAAPADMSAAVRSDDTLFSDAPFGVVRLDGEGVESAVMMDANRTLVEMTGGRAQPGKRFADLFVADQGTAALAEQLSKALDGAVNFKLAGEGQKSVDLYVVLDRQGRPSTAYVIDTTEKKLLEQRLAQGEKLQALGKMAGGLAHEFNNMLAVTVLGVDGNIEAVNSYQRR